MRGARLTAGPALALALALAPAAALPAAARADVAVLEAWAPALPPVARVLAVYFRVRNEGARPDRLLDVSSPVASSAGLHRTVHESGVARMRASGPVEIAPGAEVRFEPGGRHVMLGLDGPPPAAGQAFGLLLRFERAGERRVTVRVRPNPM